MSTVQEILVPDIGDFTDVPVVEILVSVGDAVAEGDTLIVLESDKSTLEVPAELSGTVHSITVNVDDVVSKGTLIMTLSVDQSTTETSTSSAPPAEPDPIQEQDQEQEQEQPKQSQPAPSQRNQPAPQNNVNTTTVADETSARASAVIYASPSIRRYARQLGARIDDIEGTGPKQRITRDDVERYVKARLTSSDELAAQGPYALSGLSGLPEWPQVDYASFGPVERTPLSRIAKISGPALTRNAMVIPHVTHFDKTDITELESFRQTLNSEASSEQTRITVLTFAVKAAVAALKAFPAFNSSLDGNELVVKHYWNIGIATDTPAGLLVPVIKEADQKGFRDIATEIAQLASQARAGKLPATDMKGATFSISSLGSIGGTNFTPIINAPEVAILGIARSEMQPVWNGQEFSPRLIQPLNLSFDHRVIDGVAAARFLRHIAQSLNDLRRINM
jgi:pyruvate dehydrogenase E2 component (dihydrolipoamide acetyltransferase)